MHDEWAERQGVGGGDWNFSENSNYPIIKQKHFENQLRWKQFIQLWINTIQ